MMTSPRHGLGYGQLGYWRLLLIVGTLSTTTTTTLAAAAAATGPKHRIRRTHSNNDQSRSINIINQSGVQVDIFWIHAQTRELAHSNTEGVGIPFGGDSSISSFVGHEFEVQEMPDRHGQCHGPTDGACRTTHFRVSRNEDQTFTLWDNFEITAEDHRTRAMEKAKETVAGCSLEDTLHNNNNNLDPAEQINRLSRCMDQRIQQTLAETQEEIEFQASVRVDMGHRLVHYACRDADNFTRTEPLHTRTWTYVHPTTRLKSLHKVDVPFETPESVVSVVEHVITDAQCQALEHYATAESQTTTTSSSGSGSRTTVGVPLRAKEDMIVLEFLLQVQDLVRSLTERQIKFTQDPLLFMDLRQAPTGAATKNNEEECTVDGEHQCNNSDDDDDDTFSSRRQPSFELQQAPPHAAGSVTFFCPSSTGGAVHFPKTAVHLPAPQVAGSALVLQHHHHHHSNSDDDDNNKNKMGQDVDYDDDESGTDVYHGERALCLPQEPETQLQVFTFHFN